MTDLFEKPTADAVQFGARAIMLQAGRLCSDAYTDARERFDACKPRSEERGQRALDKQRAKRDMEDAAKANRSHFKVINGDKPWTPNISKP